MAEKIRVENLYKVFGKKPHTAIPQLQAGIAKQELLKKHQLTVGVDNVSFGLEEGQFLVVMGLSGSGKSTLIRCLNRLIEPTHGKVYIDGVDITEISEEQLRQKRQAKFGMVFQRFALFPHRTVLKNAEYGLEVQGVAPELRRQKAMEALELVDLKGWEESYPDQLSGGMQQRVGLARALALDPDILLMDEAFSALDPLIRREMQDELLALQSRVNKTIVFITHDLDEALKLGDKIIIMKDGAVVQQGTPEDILTSPADDYVEKFIEDVDVSKVLTAESVMHKASAVTFPKDGPKTALHKMKEIGISSIMVVNKERQLLGMVHAEDTSKLARQHEPSLESILVRDIPSVHPSTSLHELFNIESFPVAVVDDEQKLRGIVIRGALLAAMSERRIH